MNSKPSDEPHAMRQVGRHEEQNLPAAMKKVMAAAAEDESAIARVIVTVREAAIGIVLGNGSSHDDRKSSSIRPAWRH